MKIDNGTLIDLTFLKRFAAGNPEKISKYINMFIGASDDHIKNLEESASKKDWNSVRATCHAIKPQYTYMGIKKLELLINQIEDAANTASNVEEIPVQIKQLKDQTTLAVHELQMALNSLS